MSEIHLSDYQREGSGDSGSCVVTGPEEGDLILILGIALYSLSAEFSMREYLCGIGEGTGSPVLVNLYFNEDQQGHPVSIMAWARTPGGDLYSDVNLAGPLPKCPASALVRRAPEIQRRTW